MRGINCEECRILPEKASLMFSGVNFYISHVCVMNNIFWMSSFKAAFFCMTHLFIYFLTNMPVLVCYVII